MGGKRRLMVKWAAGICGMLFIGGGNVLGVMAHRMAAVGGMAWDDAGLLRWCVTGGIWAVGACLTAVTYALGAAMEKIDAMEMWIMSLDTAVRNRDQG